VSRAHSRSPDLSTLIETGVNPGVALPSMPAGAEAEKIDARLNTKFTLSNCTQTSDVSGC